MRCTCRDRGLVDYDKISKIYDVSRYESYPETVEKLVRLLRVDSNSVLLDLGCGTGNYTSALQRSARCVIGIDISKGMIQQAQTKLARSQLVRGEVTRLPFHSQTLDGAFAIQVIHHVKNKDALLREVRRVIREEGYIAIDSCSHAQMRVHWFYHYFPRGLEVDLARIPDSEEILSLLEKAGFSDVGVETCYSNMVVTQETPESYLDENYRLGISTFSFLTPGEIESGCETLREDISSGAAYEIVQQSRDIMESNLGGSSIIYAKKC